MLQHRVRPRGLPGILIAHRLGTVMNADEIFVLKEGKLMEQGIHRELVRRDGEYACFWKAAYSSAMRSNSGAS